MQRRKFLATIGTLAAGSAGAMGSGAFTSVSAERATTISVVEDENAFLGIDKCEGPNGEYMVKENGTWGLYLNGESTPSGEGLNPNSHYRIANIFKIKNQGTQPVSVWLDPPKPSDGERSFNWANQDTGGGGSGGDETCDEDCEDHTDCDNGETCEDDCDDGTDCDNGETCEDDCEDDISNGGNHDGNSHGKNKFAPGRDFKFLNENGGGSNTGNGRGHETGDPIRSGTKLGVGDEVIIGLDITVPGDEIGEALDDERTIYASADPPDWVTENPLS